MIIKEKQTFAHEVTLPEKATDVVIYQKRIFYTLFGRRESIENTAQMIPNQNNWTFENGILTF